MNDIANTNTKAQKGVTIHFENDSQLVKHLLTDLQEEQAALIMADLDQIESLLDKRLTLLQSLSTAAKSRYDALAQAGFEANEKGMAEWLKQESSPALDRAWGDFQKQLIQAKELNRLNGILINKQFQRNQERLNALQGQVENPQVYGKNGQAKGAGGSRTSMLA